MIFKKSIYLILLLYTSLSLGQEFFVNEKLQTIDSLIFIDHNLLKAEKEADILHEWLLMNNKRKFSKAAILDVLLFKSYLSFTLNRGANKALQISLDVIDKAKKYNLPEKEYLACLVIAIMYETTGEFELCKKYLNRANTLHKMYHFDRLYSIYCVRMSSFYRLTKEKDSALFYAQRGLKYAKKFNNERELTDVYLLLGMLLSNENYPEAVKYSLLSIKGYTKRNDYESIVAQYCNISITYIKNKKYDKALTYNDSALILANKLATSNISLTNIMKIRSRVYDSLKNPDSAYYYFRKFHFSSLDEQTKMENLEVNKITKKYENDQKEAIIKNKNMWLLFIGTVGLLIAIATTLVVRKNKMISTQNKTIGNQILDLSKSLDQKQILLSELQHRVKNNLQHVISILEIQKESVDFNNIDELIRGNQNRIHSMALLHKKLNVSQSVNYVDFERYITELSELVKKSYENNEINISLEVSCAIQQMSDAKALPLGMIIVELISNSMKYAFKNQDSGCVKVIIEYDAENQMNQLHYKDNGSGFDFNSVNKKGLGMEIIKGLIDQLDGQIITHNKNGFELSVFFK